MYSTRVCVCVSVTACHSGVRAQRRAPLLLGAGSTWLKKKRKRKSKTIHIFVLKQPCFSICLCLHSHADPHRRTWAWFSAALCAFGKKLLSTNKEKRRSGRTPLMWRRHKASCSFGRAHKKAVGCGPAGSPGKKNFFFFPRSVTNDCSCAFSGG